MERTAIALEAVRVSVDEPLVSGFLVSEGDEVLETALGEEGEEGESTSIGVAIAQPT